MQSDVIYITFRRVPSRVRDVLLEPGGETGVALTVRTGEIRSSGKSSTSGSEPRRVAVGVAAGSTSAEPSRHR